MSVYRDRFGDPNVLGTVQGRTESHTVRIVGRIESPAVGLHVGELHGMDLILLFNKSTSVCFVTLYYDIGFAS
jgi:hypothetical protein